MDYEIDSSISCPKCNHSPLHNRYCLNFHCVDGRIDLHDEDGINFMPGEQYETCNDCKGTGVEWWCPGCGAELSGDPEFIKQTNELDIELDINLNF